MAMPAHSMNQIIQKIVQSIPAWPAGEKILPIMKLIMWKSGKTLYFRIGLYEAFIASPVLDKVKHVHSPGRLIHWSCFYLFGLISPLFCIFPAWVRDSG